MSCGPQWGLKIHCGLLDKDSQALVVANRSPAATCDSGGATTCTKRRRAPVFDPRKSRLLCGGRLLGCLAFGWLGLRDCR